MRIRVRCVSFPTCRCVRTPWHPASGVAALPLTDLHDAAVFLCRAHHDVALLDAVSEGLLAIDILTGLACVDCLQAVPVVGCADYHHVYILVVDDVAPILIEVFDLLAGHLLCFGGPAVEDILVDVAQGYALHLGVAYEGLQVTKSHAVATL